MKKKPKIFVSAILDFHFDLYFIISDPKNYENDTYEEKTENFRRRHLGFLF